MRFKEGDTIVEPELVDEEWVLGTVERTRTRGFVPSNYVEVRIFC